MGKTFRRNDRWKRDRRDQNFKKSKKFREFNNGGFKTPPIEPPTEVEPKEVIDDDSIDF